MLIDLFQDISTNVISRHMNGWRTGRQKALCQQKGSKVIAMDWIRNVVSFQVRIVSMDIG